MHRLEKTLLPPVDLSIYTEPALEPQYMTGRQPTMGVLYADGNDAVRTPRSATYNFHARRNYSTNISRIRVLGMSITWFIPNVNPRNNTLSFHSTFSGLIHTITIPERYYDLADSATVATDIVTALNTVTGASGITFASAAVTGSPRTYEIISTNPGRTFYWIDTSDAVAKGCCMFNFARGTSSAQQQLVGPMDMMYTKYLDIVSVKLTKYEKIAYTNTNQQGNILVRAFVGGQRWGSDFNVIDYYLAFAWNNSEPLASFDITFLDMNGDPLYIQNENALPQWNLTLGLEI